MYDLVTGLDASKRPFEITCDGGATITADTVILATGASARWLGLESETTFNGRGVSACATCDGFFYRERDVAVVGGGNTAVEEAIYLANICNSVTLIHRRDSLRAEQIMQERLLNHPKITVKWNRTLEEIIGDDSGVTGAKLAATNGEADEEIAVHGVFIAIGHDPATSAFAGAVALDAEGYIEVKTGTTLTSTQGVFAAGDCVDKIYRQAVTAAGMGCMAALDAERWLAGQFYVQEKAPGLVLSGAFYFHGAIYRPAPDAADGHFIWLYYGAVMAGDCPANKRADSGVFWSCLFIHALRDCVFIASGRLFYRGMAGRTHL